jgi:hypothetical protein
MKRTSRPRNRVNRRALLAEADVAGEDPSCNGGTLEPGARLTGRGALGPAGVDVDGALGKDSSESLEGLAGRLGAPRTAKARDISGMAVKLPCACETGGWGRISDEGPRQHNSDLSEGPWGREALASRTVGRAGRRPGHRARSSVSIRRSSEGWMQTEPMSAYVGSDLNRPEPGKAPSEMPAFKPYWGKPTVRNFRGDRGNVGIIRSPVRATLLPDRTTTGRSPGCRR